MKNKIIPIILTITVIGMLLISGGANAFELNLRLSDSNVERGQTIIITPTITITSDDSSLPVNQLVLTIQSTDGIIKKVCRFDVNGTKLSSCENVLSIRLVQSSAQKYGYGYGHYLGARRDYGYGYGYTQGNLTYELTIDTTNLPEGTYSTNLQVKIKDDLFEKSGGNFIISANPNIIDETGSIASHKGGQIIEKQSYSDQERIDINQNGEYQFKYGDEDHTLDVNNINSDSVALTVHSTPKSVYLNKNKPSMVDLDNKKYMTNDLESVPYTTNDLEVKVLYIGEDGNDATISLKGLNDRLEVNQIPHVEVTEIAPSYAKIDSGKQMEEKASSSKGVNFNDLIKNPWNWIVFFIVINLIVLILIIIITARRR